MNWVRMMNKIISYRKLRIVLMDRNLKITNVLRDCGLSAGIATRINNDDNIGVETLGVVCRYLGIDIGDGVEIVLDK